MRKFLTLLFAAIMAVTALSVPAPGNVSTAQAASCKVHYVLPPTGFAQYIHSEIRSSRTTVLIEMTKSPRELFRSSQSDSRVNRATKFTGSGTWYLEGEQDYRTVQLSSTRRYDSGSQYYAVSISADELQAAGFTPSPTNPVQLRFWLLSDNDPRSWKVSESAYVYFGC